MFEFEYIFLYVFGILEILLVLVIFEIVNKIKVLLVVEKIFMYYMISLLCKDFLKVIICI